VPTDRKGKRAKGGKSERLVVLEPAARTGQTFELGEELTVGRAPGCGVSLPEDTFISQLHARVFRRDGSLFVEDLGSTNGTFLNRKAVSTAVPLRKGDHLQVGKTVLEVAR
jgi:pSer/pThr/pTyr-binding forkhead associated (FHA) protein